MSVQDLNKPYPLVSESTIRFSSAPWFNIINKMHIGVIGAGGIGSFAAFYIARLNPMLLTIYDEDKIEEVNMAGQLYSKTSLGRKKSQEIADFICNYTETSAYCYDHFRYFEDYIPFDIVVCGIDNMVGRKRLFESWAKYAKDNDEELIFIDGRLAAEKFQIFFISNKDDFALEEYKKYLFTDEEADETICSYKQTSYCSGMIGSFITNLIVNYAANKCKNVYRQLPFYTEYSADTMNLVLRD